MPQRFLGRSPLVHIAQNGRHEDTLVALPARGGNLQKAGRSVLALGRDLHGTVHDVPFEDARPKLVPGLRHVQKAGHLQADEFTEFVTELPCSRGIGELDDASRIKGEDCVRSAVHDGVVACVLPLAQDLFALDGNRDVDDLHEASEMGRSPERTDGDIVDELSPGAGPQRQEKRMQGVGQEP